MTEIRDEYLGLVKGLKSQLDAELLAGITEIPASKLKKAKSKLEQAAATTEIKNTPDKGTSKLELMKQLYRRTAGCARCDLHKDRTNLVFGIGNVGARLCFVGEAPGRDEDKQGKPFVGRAGKLLTDIIKAMGLERKDVFIANILKCRPPANRNPETKEITACWPYLEEQLKIIQPKVICTLGKIAGMTLLETETPIGQLRGKFGQWQGIKVMPTYHPAYLLRNPHAKKIVWEDMKQIMGVLGLKG